MTVLRTLALPCIVAGLSCASSHRDSPPPAGEGGANAGQSAGAGSGGAGSGGRGGNTGGNGGLAATSAGQAGDAAAGTGASFEPPLDAGPIARPPAPEPWQPPFELGDPGWRDSREPLCTERFGGVSGDVWTDGESVFTLVTTYCNPLAMVACGGEGVTLYQNDGAGWRVLHEAYDSSPNISLSGFVAGDLIVYNQAAACAGIAHVSRDGGVRCAFTDDVALGVFAVATAGQAAYAVANDRLLSYDAPVWRDLAQLSSSSVSDIWTDGTTILIAGYQVALRVTPDGEISEIGAPPGKYGAVWSFGDDVWLANTDGELVHLDGQAWEIIDTGTGDEMLGLWGGADGVLYFIGSHSFGRWKDGAVELLAESSDSDEPIYFGGLWGNDTNEVFVLVADRSLSDFACTGVFMLFFDGSQLHAF